MASPLKNALSKVEADFLCNVLQSLHHEDDCVDQRFIRITEEVNQQVPTAPASALTPDRITLLASAQSETPPSNQTAQGQCMSDKKKQKLKQIQALTMLCMAIVIISVVGQVTQQSR